MKIIYFAAPIETRSLAAWTVCVRYQTEPWERDFEEHTTIPADIRCKYYARTDTQWTTQGTHADTNTANFAHAQIVSWKF